MADVPVYDLPATDALRAVVADLPDEPVVGIGGTALSAKPVAVLRALCDLGLDRVHLVAYASGLDAELLLARGRLRRLRAAFVGWEKHGRLPSRSALQADTFVPETFGSVIWGLEAQSRGLTFLPGPDLRYTGIAQERHLPTVTCPFTGSTYTAWPAIEPDLALVHAHAATPDGFVVMDTDLSIDRLLTKTAKRLVVSIEHRPAELSSVDGYLVTAPATEAVFVYAPGGARPGGYGRAYASDGDTLDAYVGLDPADRATWWAS